MTEDEITRLRRELAEAKVLLAHVYSVTGASYWTTETRVRIQEILGIDDILRFA